jgi:hypothetical protein
MLAIVRQHPGEGAACSKRYRNSANIADPAILPQFLDRGFLFKSLT